MTTADDLDVAVRVARALEGAGVEYALGGSVATSLLGDPRSTVDIDFAVRLGRPQIAPLVAGLGEDFEIDVLALDEAVVRRSSANIFFMPVFTKIDFFVRGDHPFDESELARRVRVETGAGPLYVASREDNILRKLAWYRLGGEVSERQWRDVLGLIRVASAPLDHTYLEEWAGPLGVRDLLGRALAQV